MFYGYWCTNSDIELVKVNNKIYALNGWNGEAYIHCWECIDKYTATTDKIEYIIFPIYQNDENDNMNYKIIDYIVL